MPTSALTSPQLAVYAKLLCLLMVVICGAAVPMEEKVRLFSVKTKGFMEASRKGPFVSARNVTFSKFTNLTIRSTTEIGVVELVFADLSPQRRLCMDKNGKLKGMKKLTNKRRQPGCLFRECVDGMYFFYLTTQHRPRLVGFHGREQLNPLGPARCCDVAPGEDGEHLVPDAGDEASYSCQRRRAPHHQVDYFFFLKKRQDNASLADTIPVHNHRQGGHNRERLGAALPDTVHQNRHHRLGHPSRSSRVDRVAGGETTDVEPPRLRTRLWGASTASAAFEAARHHDQQQRQQLRRQQRQQKQQELDQQRPHRTRHHHHLTMPARTPRPVVRVRHRKVVAKAAVKDAGHASMASINQLPWD